MEARWSKGERRRIWDKREEGKKERRKERDFQEDEVIVKGMKIISYFWRILD